MRTVVTLTVEVIHDGVSTPEIVHTALVRLASAYIASGQNVEQMSGLTDITISAVDTSPPAPAGPVWEQMELFDATPFQVPTQLLGDSEVPYEPGSLDVATIRKAIDDMKKGYQ